MSLNSVSGGSASSSWRGRRQFGGSDNTMYCECEVEGQKIRASIMTSWTDENPGRRFYGCRNWKKKNCGFFDWIDEPINGRAKQVINELKNDNVKLIKVKESSMSAAIDVEAEIAKLGALMEVLKKDSKKMRKKIRFLTTLLFSSWLLFGYFALV
ncbi:uncharacterized protein LOC131009773 [Salvia miltiorrhiza]|uniref:uncharacterized protein LOC131009773 n=1 Tax=Salvia miltiorrhiza TaxID=226208 RepID=UPI0025AD45FC|nr:uncharacterized protein LOC131009773 [Salvia miltiorrhiza]